MFNQLLRGELKSPTIIMGMYISPYISISFCFMYFKSLLIGAWISIIVVFSWQIDSFIIVKWLSLSLVIFFALKFNVKYATPAFFFFLVLAWCMFFHPFTLLVSDYLKHVSYTQHIVGSCCFLKSNMLICTFWLEYSDHLHVMWLFIWLSFKSFCYLFFFF